MSDLPNDATAGDQPVVDPLAPTIETSVGDGSQYGRATHDELGELFINRSPDVFGDGTVQYHLHNGIANAGYVEVGRDGNGGLSFGVEVGRDKTELVLERQPDGSYVVGVTNPAEVVLGEVAATSNKVYFMTEVLGRLLERRHGVEDILELQPGDPITLMAEYGSFYSRQVVSHLRTLAGLSADPMPSRVRIP